MIEKYMRKDLVYMDLRVSNIEEMITKISDDLFRKSFVTSDFGNEIIKRERTYPTALELEEFNVAIPHSDPKYILNPFIAVVRTHDEIEMYRMDDSTEKIGVKFFFILGLTEGGDHLDVLRKLIIGIQDKTFVARLHGLSDEQELLDFIIEKTEEDQK